MVKQSMIKAMVEVEGATVDDIVEALKEATRKIRDGFSSGHDSNETGSFVFEMADPAHGAPGAQFIQMSRQREFSVCRFAGSWSINRNRRGIMPKQSSPYVVAATQLRRIGCANASGDALAAMYAKMVCETNALSSKTPCIDRMFSHLCEKHENLHAEAKRLLQDPIAALEIALG